MANIPGSVPGPIEEPQNDKPTHVLPSRKLQNADGSPVEMRADGVPLESLRDESVRAVVGTMTAENLEGDGPPTAVLNGIGPRMVRVEDHGVIERNDATPQSVIAHAIHMGLEHIPDVVMTFGEEYPDAIACADAVCKALEPFGRLGLNITQVRAALLLPADARVQPISKCIGRHEYVILGPCGAGGVGTTYFVADAKDASHLLILKDVTVDRFAGRSEHSVRQARDEKTILDKAGELVDSEAEENGLRFTQFLVMPFHEGVSLHSLMAAAEGKRLPPKAACWLALCVARELRRLGDVWHLDLKGSNIIIAPELRAKVIDFGAGRIAPREGDSVQLGLHVMHTPQYSPPEMTSASPMATKTSDAYSLLILLYQMLSGEDAVPDHLVDSGQTFRTVSRVTHEYKIGQTIEGRQGLLRHLNVDDPSDPSGQNRSKIRQVTDWHAPDTEYSDAGQLVRELFHDALQNDPEKRPDIGRLVRDLEFVCRRLGIDVQSGPEMSRVERDETRLVGRQVTPQAVLAAIRHSDDDKYLLRKEQPANPRQDAEPSYDEAA